MNNVAKLNVKKEHAPDCTCSICGLNYKGFSFKSGYVCESCLKYIKNSYPPEEDTAGQNT